MRSGRVLAGAARRAQPVAPRRLSIRPQVAVLPRRLYCSQAGAEASRETAVYDDVVNVQTAGDALGLPIIGVVDAIRRGRVTAEEVVKESIKRLQHDGVLFHSVVCVSSKALGEAVALDQEVKETGVLTGPLHGVPVLVSDNIHVAGFPTTMGCAAFANYVPSQSAPVVEALVSAGAIIVGKANMDELGMGKVGANSSTGDIVNPLDPSYMTGGSQGGCASAVLSECVPLSLGCDVSGDLLIPAGFCGVHAWVPSAGSYSRSRTWMPSTSQGSVGFVAKTIADVKIVDTVLRASTAVSKEKLHFLSGIPAEPLCTDHMPKLLLPEDAFNLITVPSVERLFRATLAVARVFETRVYESVDEARYGKRKKPVSEEERYQVYAENPLEEPDNKTLREVPRLWRMWCMGLDLEAVTVLQVICKKAGVEWGDVVDKVSVPYLKRLVGSISVDDVEVLHEAEKARDELVATLERYWEEVPDHVDALVIPACVVGPQPSESEYSNTGLVSWKGVRAPADLMSRNTGPFGAVGCPMVCIPFGAKDMDVHAGSMLLVGRKGKDHELLETAATIDKQVKLGAEHLGESLKTVLKVVDPDNDKAWLDDRSKNSWAPMHDHDLASGKGGHFSQEIWRLRALHPSYISQGVKDKAKQYDVDMSQSKTAMEKQKQAAAEKLAKEAEVERSEEADEKAASLTAKLQGFRE